MPLAYGRFSDVSDGIVPLSGGGTTNFLRADGTWNAPAGGGGSTTSSYTKLSETDAAASATIDIPLDAWPGYRSFFLLFEGVQPSVDASELFLRFSSDGGSTFDAGASDYAWEYTATALATGVSAGDNADSEIQVAESIESTAGTGAVSGFMFIHDPHTTGARTNVNWECGYSPNSSANSTQISGTGARLTAQDTTDIRFLMDTGNIQVGKFILYGISSNSDGTPSMMGRSKRLEIYSDFVAMPATSGQYAGDFGVQFSGTGTQVVGATTDVGQSAHPGVAQLELGTTTTGRAAVRTNIDGFVTGGGELVFEALVRIEDLSDATNEYDFRIGFGDSDTGDHTDGMYFEYDRNSSTNWNMVVAGAATRTRTATGTAVAADTWIRLKIVCNAGGTSVAFYINDTEQTGSPLTGANIPTGFAERFGAGAWAVKSAGTTERVCYVDYIIVTHDLTTER